MSLQWTCVIYLTKFFLVTPLAVGKLYYLYASKVILRDMGNIGQYQTEPN